MAEKNKILQSDTIVGIAVMLLIIFFISLKMKEGAHEKDSDRKTSINITP
jgi:hypothetical protein